MEKMNKKFLPLIAVGALLLLGLGGFAYLNMNKGASLTTSVKEQVASSKNSIKGLLSSVTPQKCTFKDKETSEGTVYVSGGKMRGDFSSTIEGKSTVSHIIVDGSTMYTWTDDQNTGFKVAFDPEDVEEAKDDLENVDLNKEVDYNCSPWIVQGDLLTPPSDVKFADFSSFTMPSSAPNASPTTGGQSGSYGTNCSACNYLTGDDKTECLKALKC
jgi:hypothetical protein